jgi:GalNAc-alpha-(1->4)-GalNAc-alpha-(1->3)-diNAcBac-PP-undecaprenol alpha-1,4-N-acetyl-D-galactosaminyltransferase
LVQQRLRITIVTPSLAPGGAERSVVLLSEGFLNRGHEVTVVTLYGATSDSFPLPDGAAGVALDIAADSPSAIHGLWRNLRRVGALRKAILATRPAVVISNMTETNVLTKLALATTRYPVVLVEHSNPAINARKGIWKFLRRAVYPRAARLVSVSRYIDDYFSWLPKSKRVVIPNPIKVSTAEPLIASHPGKHQIAAMGRLIHVKGFDRLLEAFAGVAQKHPDWQLVIMGQGTLRSELQQLIDRLGLKKRVQLAGFVSQPFDVLRDSDFFVVSSRSEGFPYALLEAMACGLPAVAMECTSGLREIIRDGVDGLLVPDGDIAALAGALDALMIDADERRRLAAHAPEVLDRFGLEAIVDQWESLFAGVASQKLV